MLRFDAPMQPHPEDSGIAPGALIDGKYRVERVLGMGGMGVVVAAMQVALDRRVAIKLLRPGRTGPALIERMMREARAAARLKGQHVARVLDVVRSAGPVPSAGSPYIVMEYLEGRDLAAVLRKKGPLSIADAAAYVLQACEAIAEAHALGIVHRDLKPENLFLTSRVDGRPLVKVLDFGISKLTMPPPGPEGLELTLTADLVGSPSYMSPEQLRRTRNVDQRTDQWSLGVILFELLTGVLPFPANDLKQLRARVLHVEAPAVSTLRPDVPPPLVAAIARCLEKDAARRFPAVADLAEVLEPIAGATKGTVARIRERTASASALEGARPSVSLPVSGPATRPSFVSARVAWGKSAGSAPAAPLPWAERLRSRPFLAAIGVALAAGMLAGFVVLRGIAPSPRVAPGAAPLADASPASLPLASGGGPPGAADAERSSRSAASPSAASPPVGSPSAGSPSVAPSTVWPAAPLPVGVATAKRVRAVEPHRSAADAPVRR